jgi:hypothetical protein
MDDVNLSNPELKKQFETDKADIRFHECSVGPKLASINSTSKRKKIRILSIGDAIVRYYNKVKGKSSNWGDYFKSVQNYLNTLSEKSKEHKNIKRLVDSISVCMEVLEQEKTDIDTNLVELNDANSNINIDENGAIDKISSHIASFNNLCMKMDCLANALICINLLFSSEHKQGDADELLGNIRTQLGVLELSDGDALLKSIGDQEKDKEFDLALSSFEQWTNKLVLEAAKENSEETDNLEIENYRKIFTYFDDGVKTLNDALKSLKDKIKKLNMGTDSKNPTQIVRGALNKISFQCAFIKKRKQLLSSASNLITSKTDVLSKSNYFKSIANEMKALKAKITNTNEIIDLGIDIIKNDTTPLLKCNPDEKILSFANKIKEMDESINNVVSGLGNLIDKIYVQVNKLDKVSAIAFEIDELVSYGKETKAQLLNFNLSVEMAEISNINEKLNSVITTCAELLIPKEIDSEIKKPAVQEITIEFNQVTESIKNKLDSIAKSYNTLKIKLTNRFKELKTASKKLPVDSGVQQFKKTIEEFSNSGKTLKEYAMFLDENTKQLEKIKSTIASTSENQLSKSLIDEIRTPVPPNSDLAKTLPENLPISIFPDTTVQAMTKEEFERSLWDLNYNKPENRFIKDLCLETAEIDLDSLAKIDPVASKEDYTNKIANFDTLDSFITRCNGHFNTDNSKNQKKSRRNNRYGESRGLLKTRANNNLQVLSQRLSQLRTECEKLSDINSIKLHADKFNTLCNDMADFDKTLKISNNKINHAMNSKNGVSEKEAIIIINAAFNRYEAEVKDHAPIKTP